MSLELCRVNLDILVEDNCDRVDFRPRIGLQLGGDDIGWDSATGRCAEWTGRRAKKNLLNFRTAGVRCAQKRS